MTEQPEEKKKVPLVSTVAQLFELFGLNKEDIPREYLEKHIGD